jgi:hypothetical protein
MPSLLLDHHEVDRRDTQRGDGRHVALAVAAREDAAVDRRMQGLDAAVEDAGGAGQRRDVDHLETGLAQQRRGAAGRDQLDAVPGERPRKLDQPGLVRDREQRAPGRRVGHGCSSALGGVALVTGQPPPRKSPAPRAALERVPSQAD